MVIILLIIPMIIIILKQSFFEVGDMKEERLLG